MATRTFINLPVKDVGKATEFFRHVGFNFDEQFGDENAAFMILGEGSMAMLAAEPFFAGFTAQTIVDTSASREVIVGVGVDSREEVDDRVTKAVAAGGQSLGDASDDGFMYMRGFLDLDGHQWSFLHLPM